MSVRPDRVAIVLRAREGSNFLVQTRGLSAKVADDASRSVAGLLSDFALQKGNTSLHKSGNQAPGFTLGDMLVDNGRYRVVYRLVHMVYAMVVAPAAANVFFALQLLEPVTRLLIAASRGVEVTPDKLTKRYSELYLGLATMAAGADANAGRVLAEAETALVAIAPDAVKPKNMAAKLRELGTIPRLRSFGSSAAASRETSATAASTTPNSRVLEDETNPLEGISFALPPDAFKPQAVASPDPKYRGGAAADAAPAPAAAGRAAPSGMETLEDMLQASRPQTGGDANLAGTGLEALSGVAGGAAGQAEYDGPGSPTSIPVQQLAAPTVLANPPPSSAAPSDDNFFEAFTGGQGMQQMPFGAAPQRQQSSAIPTGNPMQPSPQQHQQMLQQTRAWTPAVSAEDPEVDVAAKASATTALRGPTAEEVLSIMQGRALRLRETWHASFQGSQLTSAGVTGEVVGTGQVGPSKTTAWFRLLVPAEGSRLLPTALRCCEMLKANTEKEPRQSGSFKAVVGRAPSGQAPFLRYRLPAVTIPPPLLLRVTLSFGRPQQGQQHATISFLLQWSASPNLAGPLTGLSLDLDTDAALGPPCKVSPKAAWSKQAHRLRWQLPAAVPGSQLAARVAFQPAASQTSDALAAAGILGGPVVAAAHAAKATLSFWGPEGSSLTGMALESGVDFSHMLPSSDAFRGIVTAQPAR